MLGYTDHSQAHCTRVAETAAHILKKFGYPEHDIELARIAGYMHDIGNAINRNRTPNTVGFWPMRSSNSTI